MVCGKARRRMVKRSAVSSGSELLGEVNSVAVLPAEARYRLAV